MKLEKELMLLKLLEKHTGKQNIAEKRNGIFYLYWKAVVLMIKIGKYGMYQYINTFVGRILGRTVRSLSGAVRCLCGTAWSLGGEVGSLSGTVGSLAGAVGSLCGAVGSLGGAVGSLNGEVG